MKVYDRLDQSLRRVHKEVVNGLTDSDLPLVKWTTADLCREFEVLGFAAPYCFVIRRKDGVRGTVLFRHHPRVYFGFEPET